MSPQLHKLLSVQGELLEMYLEQNTAERFAYVIMIAHRDCRRVYSMSNFRDEHLVVPVVQHLADALDRARLKVLPLQPHPFAFETPSAYDERDAVENPT